MSKEQNLGPLWNRLPKSDGYRLSIPDPVELSSWIQRLSSHQGDLPPEVLVQEISLNLGRFLGGETHRFMPNERVWRFPIDDRVLEEAMFLMEAGYSPDSLGGEFAEFWCYLTPNAQEDMPWRIAAKAEAIAQRLSNWGFNSQSEVDAEGAQNIYVTDEDGAREVKIILGFTSQAEWLEVDGPADPAFVPPIILKSDPFPTLITETLKSMQFWQELTSYAIDAIYYSVGQTPPDKILEFSKETELE